MVHHISGEVIVKLLTKNERHQMLDTVANAYLEARFGSTQPSNPNEEAAMSQEYCTQYDWWNDHDDEQLYIEYWRLTTIMMFQQVRGGVK